MFPKSNPKHDFDFERLLNDHDEWKTSREDFLWKKSSQTWLSHMSLFEFSCSLRKFYSSKPSYPQLSNLIHDAYGCCSSSLSSLLFILYRRISTLSENKPHHGQQLHAEKDEQIWENVFTVILRNDSPWLLAPQAHRNKVWVGVFGYKNQGFHCQNGFLCIKT